MDWITEHVEAEQRRDEGVGLMDGRVKEYRRDIWRMLADDLAGQLQKLHHLRPRCVDDGCLSRDQEAWVIRRLERPPYEVSVRLREYSILIEHDFRVSPIRSHGDIATMVVDIRCEDRELVYLEIDGRRVDLTQVSKRILLPIVTGQKP